MREGYDLDAVDDFVDQVIDALEGRPGGRGITPDRIEAEEFKVVRMREGYSMDDVDDWLDAAAAELRKRQQAAAQQNLQQGAQATQQAVQAGVQAASQAGQQAMPSADAERSPLLGGAAGKSVHAADSVVGEPEQQDPLRPSSSYSS
jgi:DivIVA domain-containing protein